MRLAYLSPLPPERTGIADYSAAILPELCARPGVEVEVFTSPEARRAEPACVAPLHGYGELIRRHRERGFDLVIYQMGNSPFHLEIRELALGLPGLVVLHEFMLHHLLRAATLAQGDHQGYVEEMRYCYGDPAADIARLAADPEFPLDLFDYPLFERIVDAARGVLVHNQTTRKRVLASRPEKLVGVVPSAVDLDRVRRGRDPEAARARLGIDPKAFVAGTFGLVTPAKRLEPTLRAFQRLRAERPDARLVIAGDVSPYYDLERLLARDLGGGLALGQGVMVTGRLEEPAFLDAMAMADVGINLRFPSAGETSYTLLWLLALGRPTLVTADGPAAELPESVVVPVPIGRDEESWIFEALRALAADPAGREARGARGREWVDHHHAPRPVVDGYLDFARRTLERPAPGPAAMLTAFDPGDIESRVLTQVAAALCDLGVAEGDTAALREVAAIRLDELGWRGGPSP